MTFSTGLSWSFVRHGWKELRRHSLKLNETLTGPNKLAILVVKSTSVDYNSDVLRLSASR